MTMTAKAKLKEAESEKYGTMRMVQIKVRNKVYAEICYPNKHRTGYALYFFSPNLAILNIETFEVARQKTIAYCEEFYGITAIQF